MDVLTPIEFLVQPNENRAQEGGHDNGYERRGRADRHRNH